jgi:glycosyltransferase involved in cell wall biosynthesis
LINILYIAYQFPPLNVGGSARPAKFAKHLRKLGIHPIVATLHPDDYEKVYSNANRDSNILGDSKGEIEVIEIPTENIIEQSKNKLKKFLDVFFSIYGSREKKYWQANYHKAVDSYLKTHKVAAIMVTAPPFGTLPLAVETSNKHKLPLIVDMRDPWTMWNARPYTNYLNFIRRKRKERMIFEQATKIIATSKVTLEDFKALHPSIDSSKFEYIPNGFEYDIPFKKIVTHPKKKIIVGYVGSFYYAPKSRDLIFTKWWKKKGHQKLQYVPRKEDWLYRSPYFLFKTLAQLFLKYPEFEQRIELQFAGKKEGWFQSMVEKFGLELQVKHLGWMTQAESLKFQESCDYLLITSAKVIDGKDYSIAGKTFEYFKMQKPILAFVAEGAQKDLLKESNVAYFVDIDSTENGIEQLKAILTESFTFEPNQSFINSFKVEHLTKKLASTIKEVLKK